MDIHSILQPGFTSIVGTNGTVTNSNHLRQTENTTSETEWIDLTKTADSTYSYVSSQLQTEAEAEGWTYDAPGRLNGATDVSNSVRKPLIDIWA